MLAASILDPQLDKNLGFLVNADFHAEAHKAAFKTDKETGIQQGTWDSTDPAVERERREYCLKDAYTTLLVWQRQKERLAEYGQQQYDTLKLKMPVAIQMAERGMVWDEHHAKRLAAYHTGKRDKIARNMQAKIGKDFNPGSTAKIRKLFYETCKVAPFSWTDGGKSGKKQPSTDDKTLTELLKSDNSFVVEAAAYIGEYRNHVKMLGTYVKGCKPLPGEKTVSGNWKPHTAVTGRWSCTKFDDGDKEWGAPFQVIPERMRRLFVAREGMEIVEADYAGLELRTLVLLSGAKHYAQMIADGADMHLMNARQMFSMPDMPKKHPLRKATKVLSFLSHYVGGPQTAWEGLVADEDIQKWMKQRNKILTIREVEAMQKAYFKIHPEIPAWWRRNLEEAQQRGYYLEPIFGRRVNFYGPPDISFASNFPNQALGAVICDAAMMRIWPKLKQPEEGFVAAVHDALALEGPDGQKLKDLALQEMPTTLTYEGRTMEFPVECKVDRRYVRVK
jgi:DNA polymerase-1